MKQIQRVLLIIVIGLALSLGATPAQAAKAYSADRFDVDIQIQPDGSALVTETVAFRFEGGPFTFAFRGLPTRYTDGISNLRIREGDRVFSPTGKAPGQYTLDAKRNSLETRWYFEETFDTVRTFTLSYQVAGVMRLEDGSAALRWGAIPPDHDYLIRASQITVGLPAGARVARAQVLAGVAALQTGEQSVTLTAQDIGRNREVVVGVWTPAAAFSNLPPAWQQAEIQRTAQDQASLPWGLVGAMIALVLGGGALAVARRRVPALPTYASDMAVYSAPDNLPPALAATLVKGAEGAGLGTIFDLAIRGIIQVREISRDTWRGPQSDFEFILRAPQATLAPFERVIVDAAFSKAEEPGLVTAKRLGEGLLKAQSRIKDVLLADLRTRGLIDPSRETQRNQFYLWAVVFGILAGVIGIPLIMIFRVAGVMPMIVLGILAVAAAVLGATLSVRTAEGERVAAAWTAFQNFLKHIADGQTPEASGYLEAYLPYAAAFGIEKKWVKRYADARVPIPAWFQPVAVANTDVSWVAFITAMNAASSAAGASAASAAGAGAAGGGSSGAG